MKENNMNKKLFLVVWQLKDSDEADWTYTVSDNLLTTDEGYKIAIDYINTEFEMEVESDEFAWLYCDTVDVEGYKIKLVKE